MLFPYHAQIAYELKERRLLTPATRYAGSSAGAIVAAALACDLPQARVDDALANLFRSFASGTELRFALRDELRAVLPEDAPERARGRLTVAYARLWPPWSTSCLVSEWESKEDMVDTICASCNWPGFFSRWPLVWCRGALALDGYFAVKRERFGCPPVELSAKEEEGGGGGITLHVVALPGVPTRVEGERDAVLQPRLPTTPGGGEEGLAYALPYQRSDWFGWALGRGMDTDVLRAIGDLGSDHAVEWLERNGYSLAEAGAKP